MIDQGLREAARHMLGELESRCLRVALAKVPGYQRRKVRVVEESNPDWYRKLCAEYPANRGRGSRQMKLLDTGELIPKVRTIIKRESVINALEHIVDGKNGTVYTERVLPYVEEERDRWEDLMRKAGVQYEQYV